jgi:hypothetical protein
MTDGPRIPRAGEGAEKSGPVVAELATEVETARAAAASVQARGLDVPHRSRMEASPGSSWDCSHSV